MKNLIPILQSQTYSDVIPPKFKYKNGGIVILDGYGGLFYKGKIQKNDSGYVLILNGKVENVLNVRELHNRLRAFFTNLEFYQI